MSKGKWKKGPVSPRITLFLRVARSTKDYKCSHCTDIIPAGSFFIKLSAAYGATRYWTFHLDRSCMNEWAYAKLLKQAQDIEAARGINPLTSDPYNPHDHVRLERTTDD